MTIRCPECGDSHTLLVAPLFEVRVHTFLFWRWAAKHRSGFLIRCTSKRCGLDWRYTADGVTHPCPASIPGRGGLPAPAPSQPPAPNGSPPGEREPAPALGTAVRRPQV